MSMNATIKKTANDKRNAICTELGKNLKRLRIAADKSQETLAFDAEVDRTYISQIERGVGNPSIYIAILLFVVINGHLTVLMAVVKSFDAFPVGASVLEALARVRLYQLGTDMFASALWLALPMIGLLLFVNLALGIISRVAPQMNIYAVGFPVTLTAGMAGIALVLPMLEQPLVALLERVLMLFG